MRRVLTTILLTILSISSLYAQQIRIACIGNSITFGAGIEERAANSYPSQLQKLLGEGYIVKNYGVNSRTALSKGNFPYIETPEYRASLEFEPDILFIKLGTNDSKAHNFVHIDEFEADYQAIIDSYRVLDSAPRIILITPLKCFGEQAQIYTISNERLVETITPAIERLAQSNGLEIINGYPLCGTEPDLEIMPDKLHPSAKGAAMIAEHLSRVILTPRDEAYDIFEQLEGGTQFNFHGYSGREYNSNTLSYKIVAPHKSNAEHKWVLRARFWGHQPQLDLQLLEMGYHITYCDVAALYGSDEAVDRWDKFYTLMRSAGLSKKVVLEGMSRGGLIVYNWAAKNPKRVEAIYADAPVMNLKSWPMGYAKATRESEEMYKAYGSDHEGMTKYKGNPIDHAKRIAKAKIPIIHVVGATDDVVPVVDNTALFAQRVRAYGHDMVIITKEGVGHHPHSLGNPKPITDFILNAGE